jgi:outer membrane protein assembly factor BamE (lipoprotein component of BamABCDE complex)
MDFDDFLFWLGAGYACAADQHDCVDIEEGMTEQQVSMILGSPSKVEQLDDSHGGQRWIYLDLLDTDYFEVRFRRGKVVSTSY